MSSKAQTDLIIRPATADDGPECGQICYDAFSTISAAHAFPCDFPGPAPVIQLLSMMFSAPGFYGVVAECDGRIVGSNVLSEQGVIQGVGPISVDPRMQNVGVGRRLMQAVMDRASQNGAAGIRLVQGAYHNRSLSLYASLGFDIREPLSCMQGRTKERDIPGCVVRSAKPADEAVCNALSQRIHGFNRGAELAQAIQSGTARVVERADRVTGYTTDLGYFGHSTAETYIDIQALLTSVESFSGAGVLVPSRNNALMRWCLANGLRVVQPMTLMSIGFYNDPAGAWLPSVIF